MVTPPWDQWNPRHMIYIASTIRVGACCVLLDLDHGMTCHPCHTMNNFPPSFGLLLSLWRPLTSSTGSQVITTYLIDDSALINASHHCIPLTWTCALRSPDFRHHCPATLLVYRLNVGQLMLPICLTKFVSFICSTTKQKHWALYFQNGSLHRKTVVRVCSAAEPAWVFEKPNYHI